MNDTPSQVAKRHHTVPKFYLRGFAREDQIATIRLPGDQRFLQSVNDAAVEKHFYTVDGHEEGADVVERALSEVEGRTATIFEKVIAGSWPLDLEDRSALGYFITLQATRVPALRKTMDYVGAQMLRLQIGAGGKAAFRRQLEDQGREVNDDLVEDLWAQATRLEGPPIKQTNVEHIQHMAELSEELVKYIIARPWTLIRFDRRSLVTSDAPVGLIGDPRDEQWQGVGYMTAWGITFPLTRKIGLLMSSIDPLIELKIPVEHVHRGRADAIEAGTTSMEKFLNSYTVANAAESIFHHPDDEAFVPEPLPSPEPVTMKMNAPAEFTGEPWFDIPDHDGSRGTTAD
ncbi:DUF4238 domain-containing protein [Nocardioides glacieisoli]|uniref:DUF4238 domain-containing protein n=1 Tax=Nocardioides glacieisoli TaxID=1168730 RepID=A0A4Q2RHY9_9ACTN|nr:DUF4238 domain-containing protein [Nocardioides glacieisoli]RYB88330.1 DUF4238 domain-containing protein [Nocardioides glacieisoli]